MVKMYYRFIIKKNDQISGLFHPKKIGLSQKREGYMMLLEKTFLLWDIQKILKVKVKVGLRKAELKPLKVEELKEFYSLYGVTVSMQSKENLTDIVDQDEFQVWCLKK